MKGRDDGTFSMKNSADLDFSINVQKNKPTSKEKIRTIFDNISLNVISFLEKHRGVTDVKVWTSCPPKTSMCQTVMMIMAPSFQFFERPPVTEFQINEWEKKFYPCKLPSDYKSFLMISDGFVLKWHMKYNREVLPLGNMSLCPLEALKPVKFDKHLAFNLDSNNATDGTIAFVFDDDANNESNPSIWFEDLSCHWNFICHTFSNYFRLIIMHFGLPNWQYSFSKVGLHPITRQWLRFLVPNRLDIDLRHNANGFGWVLPKPTKNKKNEHQKKRKRKKLNLNKIDQIVSAQLSKDKTKMALPNNARPGSAPNRNKHFNQRARN